MRGVCSGLGRSGRDVGRGRGGEAAGAGAHTKDTASRVAIVVLAVIVGMGSAVGSDVCGDQRRQRRCMQNGCMHAGCMLGAHSLSVLGISDWVNGDRSFGVLSGQASVRTLGCGCTQGGYVIRDWSMLRLVLLLLVLLGWCAGLIDGAVAYKYGAPLQLAYLLLAPLLRHLKGRARACSCAACRSRGDQGGGVGRWPNDQRAWVLATGKDKAGGGAAGTEHAVDGADTGTGWRGSD
jgi:hypothetical protein